MSKPSSRLRIKRVYDAPASDDGLRVLVDRLWPRGIAKSAAALDHWARELSPSDELRRWYRHDHARWEEFRDRYFAELDACPEEVAALLERFGDRPATLLFGSKEPDLNNARALKEYLEARATGAARKEGKSRV